MYFLRPYLDVRGDVDSESMTVDLMWEYHGSVECWEDPGSVNTYMEGSSEC